MTNRVVVTVADLLPDSFPGMEEAVKAELLKEGAAGIPGFAWKLVGTEASEVVRQALHVDVFELLALGWCTARELHGYADPARHPGGEKSLVFLGEHTLTSTSYPTIMVKVGAKEFPAVRLTLELSADFRTAALTIESGHIQSLSTGDCSVSAQLLYGDIKLHEPLKSRDVTLPGKLEFKAPGLAIPF